MTLSSLVQTNTEHGRTIVDFLVDVMNGEFHEFQPGHRLTAAKLLMVYGHEDTADFIADDSSPDLFTRPATRRSLKVAGVNPVLVKLIMSQTGDGHRVIDYLVSVMEGRIGKARPCHRMAAARELLERGFGKSSRRDLPRPPRSVQPANEGWLRRDYHADGTQC